MDGPGPKGPQCIPREGIFPALGLDAPLLQPVQESVVPVFFTLLPDLKCSPPAPLVKAGEGLSRFERDTIFC